MSGVACVLEACFGKRFDLEDLLPYLCRTVSARDAEGSTTRGQLQNVFVSVTRASRLVAIAMHSDRADARSRERLEAQGWQVFDWTSSVGKN